MSCAAPVANQQVLAELQHRIKNIIGVVTSIVWTRSRESSFEEVRTELQAVAERIQTLRFVHEQLYADGAADGLPLRQYLATLAEALATLYGESFGRSVSRSMSTMSSWRPE